MKPYYADDYVELYLADSTVWDGWLGADVLITDPPYGVGGVLSLAPKPGWAPTFHRDQTWDHNLAARNTILGMWGTDRPSAVFASPKMGHDAPPFRGVPLIWEKGDAVGMGDVTFPWRPSYELIYVNGPGWNGHRGSSVLRHQLTSGDASAIGHPTPKPVPLMADLIRKAPPGVIADPFAGSGSTLRAAKDLGRRAIGVELNEAYAEVAARRLAQDTLFTIGDPVPVAPAEGFTWEAP